MSLEHVVDYTGQCTRRTYLDEAYLESMKLDGIKVLYRAWLGHFNHPLPRMVKAKFIEGLLDEEVSIDWGRVIEWYHNVPEGTLPPTKPPPGIVEQFYFGDHSMYQAVTHGHAEIPDLEELDGKHDLDVESEDPPEQAPSNLDNEEEEDLFAPDAVDEPVPPPSQPRTRLEDAKARDDERAASEAADMPDAANQSIGADDGARDVQHSVDAPDVEQDILSALTPLPSTLNVEQTGEQSASPARRVQPVRGDAENRATVSTAAEGPEPENILKSTRAERIRAALEAGGFLDSEYHPPTSTSQSPGSSRASSPAGSDGACTVDETGSLDGWEPGPDDPTWQYYVRARQRESMHGPLFGTDDRPWDGHGVLHGQTGIVALAKDCRKDPEGKGPRVLVFLSGVWIRYRARTQTFTVSSHALVCAVLEHPIFLEGDVYITIPLSFEGEQCLHIIGGVDCAREAHLSLEPVDIELSLLENTIKKAFFSVSMVLNPPLSTIPQKRARSDSWAAHSAYPQQPSRPRMALPPRAPAARPSLPPAMRPTMPTHLHRHPTPGPNATGTSQGQPARPVARPDVKGKGIAAPDDSNTVVDDEDDDEIMEVPPPPRAAQGGAARTNRAGGAPIAGGSRQQVRAAVKHEPAASALSATNTEMLKHLRQGPWESSHVVAAIRASALERGDNGSRTLDVLRQWAYVVGVLTEAPTPWSDGKKNRVPSAVIRAFLDHSEDWSQNAYQVYRYLQQEASNERMRALVAAVATPGRSIGMGALARHLKPGSTA